MDYQELSLSTNTVVLKQGKLQHAAVYMIKFRMISIKTEYVNDMYTAKHPCINDLVYLTIIRRRQGEYCRIIPETKSRGLFDNIHRA